MLSNFKQSVLDAGVLSIDIETSTSNPATKSASKKVKKEVYEFGPFYKGKPLDFPLVKTEDLEALGKDYGLSVAAPVVVISLAWSDQTYLIEDPYPGGKGWNDLLTLKEWSDTLPILWVAHNAIFDFRALGLQFDIRPKRVWCTLVNARIISFRSQEYNLLALCDYYNIPVPSFMRQAKSNRSDILAFRKTPEFNAYAIADARLALEVYMKQAEFIKGKVNYTRIVEREVEVFNAYLEMCVTGVPISIERAREEVNRLNTIIADSKQFLSEKYGISNPASPKEADKFLYVLLGIPLPDHDNPDHAPFFTAKDNHSASTDVVTVYAEQYKDDPSKREALLNLAWYRLAMRKKKIVESLIAHACLDGRIHSMIVPATTTGRRASSHPNLQNIQMAVDNRNPIYAPIGSMTFIWSPTFNFRENDVNRAELMMAAALSSDNQMAQACMAGDMHREMARVYFGHVFDEAEPKEQDRLRGIGKNVTFALNYGSGAFKIAQTINLTNQMKGNPDRVTKEEIQEMIDKFTRRFSQLSSVKERIISEAENRGYVNLWTGRPVYIDQNRAYTTAWNALCQGGVSELMKLIILYVRAEFIKRNMKARIVLEIHDSIIIDCPAEEDIMVQDILSEAVDSCLTDQLKNKRPGLTELKWKMGCEFDKNDYKWGLNNSDRPPSQKIKN